MLFLTCLFANCFNSWFPCPTRLTSPVRDSGKKSIRDYLSLLKQDSMGSLNEPFSSTLTPMHLRKAKLMFFWVRYPSSAVLKMYFPDIKFNKNNTAQLVKWFSNFRWVIFRPLWFASVIFPCRCFLAALLMSLVRPTGRPLGRRRPRAQLEVWIIFTRVQSSF